MGKAPPISMDEAPPTSGLYDVAVTATAPSNNFMGNSAYGAIPTRTSASAVTPSAFQGTTHSGMVGTAWPNQFDVALPSPSGYGLPTPVETSFKSTLYGSPALSVPQSLNESTTIRIVGFPPEKASDLLDHFYNLAPASAYKSLPGSNWMTITYKSAAGVQKALTYDQAVLMGGSMIAVTSVANPDSQNQLQSSKPSTPVAGNLASASSKFVPGSKPSPINISPGLGNNSIKTFPSFSSQLGGQPSTISGIDGTENQSSAAETQVQLNKGAFMPPKDRKTDISAFSSSNLSGGVGGGRRMRIEDDLNDSSVTAYPVADPSVSFSQTSPKTANMVDDFDENYEEPLTVFWKTPFTASSFDKERAAESMADDGVDFRAASAASVGDNVDDSSSKRKRLPSNTSILVPESPALPLTTKTKTVNLISSGESTPVRLSRAASPDVILASSDGELPPSNKKPPATKRFPKLGSLSSSSQNSNNSFSSIDLSSFKYDGPESDTALWTSTVDRKSSIPPAKKARTGFVSAASSRSDSGSPIHIMTPPKPAYSSSLSMTTSVGSPGADADLVELMDMFPNGDINILRRALKDANWDLSTAKLRLLESDPSEEPPKRKGKLVKKANRSSSPTEVFSDDVEVVSVKPASARANASLLKKSSKAAKERNNRRKQYSDDEENDYSDGFSDDSNGGGGSDDDWEQNQRTLDFFNTASKKEFLDTLLCSEENADLIFGMRPFEDVEHLRSCLQSSKTKKTLHKLIDKYEDIMSGYTQVDRLIEECEHTGKQIMDVLNTWTKAAHEETDTSDKPEDGAGEFSLTQVADDADAEVEFNPDDFKSCFKKQPPFVNSSMTLKSYQLVGISWLNLLHSMGLGGILADEMGLGKTCQVICFLGTLKHKGVEGPHLVIVPSSTIENWLREFQKWCPHLNVVSYYGSQSERADIRMDLEDEVPDIVVTTYNLASGAKEDRMFLKRYGFQTMILDEGHMVKNMGSSRYKALTAIRATFRVLLTGTPLQNNLMELLSLLTFILPDIFRNEEETLNKIFNITKPVGGNDPNSTILSRQRIGRARKMMTPFVLRRKKAQVLRELPQKLRSIEMCRPTQTQNELYQALIADCKKTYLQTTIQNSISSESISLDDASPKKKKGKATRKVKPMPANSKRDNANILMMLRKVANHPLLFRRIYTDAKIKSMARDIMKEEEYHDANYDYIREDMEVMSDFELNKLCKNFKSIKRYQLANEEWMDAGKVQKLKEMLPALIERGDRILIFSQFVIMLDVLEYVMNTLNIKFLRLDGQTNVIERQPLIDEFNEDPSIKVFLLSTKAGGLGLNLTSANVVIIFDMDFNPHNDNQAEDRSHRVGQTRDVHVIKFVLEGSVEQHILRLADTKLNLDQRLQGEHVDDEEEEKKGKGKDKEVADEVEVPEEAAETLMGMLRNEWLGNHE
ncbi:hypothetical protein HDV05_006789 [Chytridiales sp. JEL 0842]|nr:hypothetical protein HDV05_006789 [Chytridiales sp. JEL 0842]